MDFQKPGTQDNWLGEGGQFKPMDNGYPGGAFFDPFGLSRGSEAQLRKYQVGRHPMRCHPLLMPACPAVLHIRAPCACKHEVFAHTRLRIANCSRVCLGLTTAAIIHACRLLQPPMSHELKISIRLHFDNLATLFRTMRSRTAAWPWSPSLASSHSTQRLERYAAPSSRASPKSCLVLGILPDHFQSLCECLHCGTSQQRLEMGWSLTQAAAGRLYNSGGVIGCSSSATAMQGPIDNLVDHINNPTGVTFATNGVSLPFVR